MNNQFLIKSKIYIMNMVYNYLMLQETIKYYLKVGYVYLQMLCEHIRHFFKMICIKYEE